MEPEKACSLSSCSACFRFEAKLVATEFEVQRQRAPSMFGPPFVIIQFVWTISANRKSLKTSRWSGKGMFPPDRLIAARWLGRTDSRWCGYIWCLRLFSKIFISFFFLLLTRKSQHILDSLPGTIARESSNPQTTLSFLYSFCLWFFS